MTIKNGELVKNTLFSKKVKLADTTSVHRFARDIKLISGDGRFIIDAQVADPTSLQAFANKLKTYNLPSV